MLSIYFLILDIYLISNLLSFQHICIFLENIIYTFCFWNIIFISNILTFSEMLYLFREHHLIFFCFSSFLHFNVLSSFLIFWFFRQILHFSRNITVHCCYTIYSWWRCEYYRFFLSFSTFLHTYPIHIFFVFSHFCF